MITHSPFPLLPGSRKFLLRLKVAGGEKPYKAKMNEGRPSSVLLLPPELWGLVGRRGRSGRGTKYSGQAGQDRGSTRGGGRESLEYELGEAEGWKMGLGGARGQESRVRGQGSGISFGQGPLRQVFLLALGVPAKDNHTVKRLKTPGEKKNQNILQFPLRLASSHET